MPEVLVLGANGHLGRHLVGTLLQKGYRVRAGIRSLLHPLPTWEGRSAQVVQADILDGASLDHALRGVTGVFHCAAPTALWAKNVTKEIASPILQGTLQVIEAAHRQGVKKILYTSTCAAIGFHAPKGAKLTETDWNRETQHPQFKSKVQAEIQGEQLAKKYGISFVRICPPSIVGPGFYRSTPSTAPYVEWCRGKKIAAPDLAYHVVDVRDLALAQVHLYEKTDAQDRYIVCGPYTGTQEVIDILRRGMPFLKKPILLSPSMLRVVWGLEWGQHVLTGVPRTLTRTLIRECGRATQQVDGSRFLASCEPGWVFTPLEKTLWDMVQWIQRTKIT